jgi:hypothetical protein
MHSLSTASMKREKVINTKRRDRIRNMENKQSKLKRNKNKQKTKKQKSYYTLSINSQNMKALSKLACFI